MELEDPPFAEMFWGAYLSALVEAGAVTERTPPSEVEQMHVDFMSGLRGEAGECTTRPET